MHSFRTLAAQTGWPDDPLKLHFRKGLSAELQSELACRDEGKTLDQFIDLAIRIDNLLRSRRQPRVSSAPVGVTAPPPDSEPMQIGFTHLSEEERDRCMRKNLSILWTLRTYEGYLSYSFITQRSGGEF